MQSPLDLNACLTCFSNGVMNVTVNICKISHTWPGNFSWMNLKSGYLTFFLNWGITVVQSVDISQVITCLTTTQINTGYLQRPRRLPPALSHSVPTAWETTHLHFLIDFAWFWVSCKGNRTICLLWCLMFFTLCLCCVLQ